MKTETAPTPVPATETDVVVVGGGPVGFVTAFMLAERGWRVQILEKQPRPYRRPRAVGLDQEAMRIMQGIGFAPWVLAHGSLRKNYDWLNTDGELLLRFDRSAPGTMGWPNINFSQPEFEELIEQRAQSHPLIEIRRGVEAIEVQELPVGVSVTLGDTESGAVMAPVLGQYLVACDGANSTVRDLIGSETEDLGLFYDWLVVDVIPTIERDWDERSIQICSPERPTTILGSGAGRRRWEFMLLPGEDPKELATEEAAWRLLEVWDVDPSNAILERHAVYTFQARYVRAWRRGRVLLAGDAAHQMPPFAAQGLCSGLRDARNLAWKLDLVLAGKASDALLDTYTTERAEHVRHAIHFSVELGKVICLLDPELAAQRDANMLRHRGDPDAALPPLPPDVFTAGVVRVGEDGLPTPVAGRIAPQFRVRGLRLEGLFDDVVGQRAVLLQKDDGHELASETASSFADLGGQIVTIVAGDVEPREGVVADIHGSYGAELERLGAVAVLWRPDGYYFGAASDAADVQQLLLDYVDAVTVGKTPLREGIETVEAHV